jgi:hypothetical protein
MGWAEDAILAGVEEILNRFNGISVRGLKPGKFEQRRKEYYLRFPSPTSASLGIHSGELK